MNLSHAVAVVLYELSDIKGGNMRLSERFDQNLMYDHIQELLNDIDYPVHKKDKTMLMLKRILGRARLSSRELQTIRSLIRRIQHRFKHPVEK